MFKIKEITPLFNQIVTTMNMYKEVTTNSGLIDTRRTNTIKEYQTVIAVGPHVNGIKPGDVVFINPRRYMEIEHRKGRSDLDANVQKDDMHITLNIPQFDLYDRPDGSCRTVLMLFDNDITFVAKGEEFDETGLYKPAEKKLTDVSPLFTPDYAVKN